MTIEELEALVRDLQATIETQKAELASRDETIASLAAQSQERANALDSELASRDETIASLNEHLGKATARYRQALLTGSPDLPEELVSGATIDEIDASMAAARQIVDKIRQRQQEQAAAETVPAGAPARGIPDLSSLSPTEKIRAGLAN